MQNSKKWHAVYTKPRWEKKVADLLTKKNIENYCPVTRVNHQWSDRKKIILEPLFISYVFIYIDESQYQSARTTSGVINFVYWLNKPALIRNDEIDTIKRFLNEYDKVQLEKIEVSHDDTVRITNGLLMGQKGQILSVNNKWVKVILPSLGFMMQAEVNVSHVEIIKKKEPTFSENLGLQYNITG
ncbi:MAG TPA: UpxY family transcription antiterminator [Puia sp.]|jgi:transcription antitermination factor NusG|nr:UpxY family transcription antiterminator [Puia sp.]